MLEATPDQKRKFTDYLHGQQDGTGPKPSDLPDGGPRASKLHRGMSDLLAGKPAPSDTPDAPAGVDSDVWKAAVEAAGDPQSPSYEIASALLEVAQQLRDLKEGSAP